jgi:O-antigen ligase
MAVLLLLYGISMGFPDLAISLGSTRLRLDDIVLIFISFCVIIELLFRPLCLTKSQFNFLRMIFLFIGFCIISLSISLIAGLPFESYSFLRMLGCMPILVTLPLALRSSKRIRWLGWGLLSGGLIFMTQLFFLLYKALQVGHFTYFFRLKNAVSFRTWNPNSSSVFALMLVVALFLIGSEMQGVRREIFSTAAALFSLVPFLLYSRGAMAAVVFAWFVFILLARKNYRFKVFVVLVLVGIVVFQAVFQKDLLSSAISIDLKASETQSISEHYIMWHTALDLATDSPLYGYGFGQEIRSFEARIGRGMAHNAFLSVLVEGGLIGLFLFMWPLKYLARRLWTFAHGSLYDMRAVIGLSFLFGIIIQSLSQSALYWHKPPMLMLSLLSVYIGRIERSVSCSHN